MMNRLAELIRREPLVVRSTVTAALGLLAAYGVALTDVQAEAVLTAAAVVLPAVVAWWTRGRVTPVDRAEE